MDKATVCRWLSIGRRIVRDAIAFAPFVLCIVFAIHATSERRDLLVRLRPYVNHQMRIMILFALIIALSLVLSLLPRGTRQIMKHRIMPRIGMLAFIFVILRSGMSYENMTAPFQALSAALHS